MSASGTTEAAVLTVGYGNTRSSEEFIDLLKRYRIRFLVDVRSKPYSRHRPEFSKDGLEAILRAAGFSYIFLGNQLGGLPDDPACYRDGKVDYTLVREQTWFQEGLDRIQTGWASGHALALMCAELEPERCHRTKLIGEALVARGVVVGHIDEDGDVITHAAAMDRLTGGQGQLFDRELTSRKAYRPHSAEEPQ